MGTFISWIGGGLGRAAATGCVVGIFFMLTGVLPWEFVVEMIVDPAYWLTNGFTRVMLVIVGLALIYSSLRWNVWSNKQKVINELAEELSWAIKELLNRPVSDDQELGRLESDIATWCDKVNGVLGNEAFFTRADQIHFDRLGKVPVLRWKQAYRLDAADTRHDHALNMLSLKFDRLRDVVNWAQQRIR